MWVFHVSNSLEYLQEKKIHHYQWFKQKLKLMIFSKKENSFSYIERVEIKMLSLIISGNRLGIASDSLYNYEVTLWLVKSRSCHLYAWCNNVKVFRTDTLYDQTNVVILRKWIISSIYFYSSKVKLTWNLIVSIEQCFWFWDNKLQ